MSDPTPGGKDSTKTGHLTEGDNPVGGETADPERGSPHKADDSLDRGHTKVSELQVSVVD